jgi:hypothetical protein
MLGRHVVLCFPGFPPYDVPRSWRIDDTGGALRRRYKETGVLHLELRFTDPEHAKQFGVRSAVITMSE